VSTFPEALSTKQLVLTAELPLLPEMSADSVRSGGKSLFDSVDSVLLTDNEYGKTHMSTSVAAGILKSANIDPIVQLSCRNRNRIALISELLGLRALDISSVMLIQGNKVPKEFMPRPKSVMDMQAKELIATARMINDDENIAGKFHIVAAGTVHDPQPGWRSEELNAKAAAGAQTILTQLCFDAELLKRYMKNLVEQRFLHQANVVVSLGTLTDANNATRMRDTRRRALIPPAIIKRLQQAGNPEAEGVAICAELLQQYSEIPGISGVNLVTGGDLETIGAAVSASGLR